MKYRNQFLKYKLHCHASPDGGGGGGGDAGAGGDANANAGGDTGGQQGDGNNNDGNLISHDNLWDTDTNAGQQGNANDNQQGQQQAAQQPNANEQFQQHIDSLDFLGGVNPTELMTALQNGDADAFGKALSQIGVNAYRNSMVDANKVVQQRVDKMGSTLKQDIGAQNATGQLVSEMNNQLPFTKSPAYAPIAKLVLTQFLEKGSTPEKAIEGVGKYFNSLSGEVAKLSPGAPKGRPSGGFGGNMNGSGDGNSDADEPDWVDILGGPAAQ